MAATSLPIKRPGSGGIDRREEIGSVDALHCTTMMDLDIWPTDEATRVLPRRPCRRFGIANDGGTATPNGVGAFSGKYFHAWIWYDGAGATQFGMIASWPSARANWSVSGWPTASGNVKVYRTVSAGTTLKLVATISAATSPYTDTTADGSLGAEIDWDDILAPLGDTTFTQANIIHWLGLVRSANETNRVLLGIGTTKFFANFLDDVLQESSWQYSGGGGTTRPIAVAPLGDSIWLATGATALKYIRMGAISGGIRTASQPAAPTWGSTSQVAGALSAVTGHNYVAVQRDPYTGMCSAPTLFSTWYTGYTNMKNQFTIGGTAGNKADIYRTSDGGQFYQFLKTIDIGFASDDEAADSTLSTQTVRYDVGAPVSGFKWITAWKGLLFGMNLVASGSVEAAPSGVYASNAGAPFNFANPDLNPEYVRQIDDDDGDEIVGAIGWAEAQIIFKKQNVFMFTGDPPTGFRWAPVSGARGYGCIAPRTIVQTPIGLIWLSSAGVCLMREPGAAPELISDAIRELVIDPARATQSDPTATVQSEQPAMRFDIGNPTAASQTVHVRVQFDKAGDFATPAADYDTKTSGDIGYFRRGAARFAAAGESLAALTVARITVLPAKADVEGGSEYYVRYALDTGSGWGDWTTLRRTYFWPADDYSGDVVSGDYVQWAHAASYPPRGEYWLWIPTGTRKWADRAYVLNYSLLQRGGSPLWRGPVMIPATAACFVDALAIDGKPAADYLFMADADGLLWVYPWLYGGPDRDNRATVLETDRDALAVTVASGVLTASGTTWPTTYARLKGSIAAVKDSAGRFYHGLVTASTATTLTVTWLGGRSPADGAVTLWLGGMVSELETGWLPLSGEPTYIAKIKDMRVHSGPAPASLHIDVEATDGPQTDRSGIAAVSRDIAIGEGAQIVSVPIDLSGNLHRIRMRNVRTTIDAGDFEVRELNVDIEQTGSQT